MVNMRTTTIRTKINIHKMYMYIISLNFIFNLVLFLVMLLLFYNDTKEVIRKFYNKFYIILNLIQIIIVQYFME